MCVGRVYVYSPLRLDDDVVDEGGDALLVGSDDVGRVIVFVCVCMCGKCCSRREEQVPR